MESILAALLSLLMTAQASTLAIPTPTTVSQPTTEVRQSQTRSRASIPAVPKKQPKSPIKSPAPVPTTPLAAPQAPIVDMRAQIEQSIFEETNAVRAQNGLSPLSADTRIGSVSRAHSHDMLANNYFSHTNSAGCNAGCRLSNAGYVWQTYGENIHWMSGYALSPQDTAKKVITDWLNSPPHRANLLGNFKSVGVGVAVSDTKIYSTVIYTIAQ